MAFSPDGKRLASASKDGTVKVWDAASGQEMLSLKAGIPQVSIPQVKSVVFSPDGRRLASVSMDGTVKVWETALAGPGVVPQRDGVRLGRVTRQRLQKSAQLNDASWAIVRNPGTEAGAYRRALAQAEEAVRLAPDDGNILNTLGVAQYRVGEYQKALDSLTRSDQINSARNQGSLPEDLAFLAMAHHRLGHRKKAQALLARRREATKKAPWDKDSDAQAILREAEALVQSSR